MSSKIIVTTFLSAGPTRGQKKDSDIMPECSYDIICSYNNKNKKLLPSCEPALS